MFSAACSFFSGEDIGVTVLQLKELPDRVAETRADGKARSSNPALRGGPIASKDQQGFLLRKAQIPNISVFKALLRCGGVMGTEYTIQNPHSFSLQSGELGAKMLESSLIASYLI